MVPEAFLFAFKKGISSMTKSAFFDIMIFYVEIAKHISSRDRKGNEVYGLGRPRRHSRYRRCLR